MSGRLAFLFALIFPQSTLPCETVLLRAMDVSGPVDASQYHLRTSGLAAALRDGAPRDLLLHRRVAVNVMQWSGPGKQRVMIDWTAAGNAEAVADLATTAAAMPRAFEGGGTALGEVLFAAAAQFARPPPVAIRSSMFPVTGMRAQATHRVLPGRGWSGAAPDQWPCD